MTQIVGVIGGGTTGSGLAEVCARAGCNTVAYERDTTSLAEGKPLVGRSVGREYEVSRRFLFAEIDNVLADARVILASNTSSIRNNIEATS
jgi:3-hydroxybutyryl-CoA dehydrogenase